MIILENHATSMTWDDQASACKFGRDWAKTWMFVSNRPDILAAAQACDHPRGQDQAIIGVLLDDGAFMSRLTAEYPPQLAAQLADIILPHVTKQPQVLQFDDWATALPQHLEWPRPATRIEDGGRAS